MSAENDGGDDEWGSAPPKYSQPPSRSEMSSQPRYDDANSDDCELVNVPTKDIGLVIGRGGGTIRELEREFGVRVQLDRQSGEVRIIGGQNESQRKACVSKINSILSGSDRPASGARGVGRGRFDGPSGQTNDQWDQNRGGDRQPSYRDAGTGDVITISVSPQDVGMIIGRGGSKIQEMERNSGARIKVNRDALQVIISGNSDCQKVAADLINEVCGKRSVSSSNESGNRYQGYNAQSQNTDNGYGGGFNSRGGHDGGYNSRPSYKNDSAPAYTNSSSSALVEPGWGDEDWGSGTPTNSNAQYVPQQPQYEQRNYNQSSYRSSNDNYHSGSSSYNRNSSESYNRGSSDNYNRSNQYASANGYGGNQQSSGSYSRNQYSSGGHERNQYASRNEDRGNYQSSNNSNNKQSSFSGWGDENDNTEDTGYSGGRSSAPAQRPPVDDAPIDWEACIKHSEELSTQRWAHLPPVIKDFYREDPEVAALMEEEVAEFRKSQNNIMVSNIESDSDLPIPNPVLTFEQAFSGYPEIMGEIHKNKFVRPSPVQSQTWPLLLSGRDVIAIAQTGTGKTLAFLLPAFIHIEGQITPRDKRTGPSVICLCPTRELAQQIYQEVLKYNYRGIKAVCVYGGKGRREQIAMCQQGVEIVIATPGRLNDLIQNGFISLENVTYLVLDEADRMLDMGFEPDIRKVLLDIRPDRQSVMTSATWPYGVRKMASRYLKNPAQIYVGSLDLNAVHTVRQEIRFVAEEEKRRLIFDFIANELGENEKLLVFCGRKSTCSDVASDLSRNDIPCESIHGDREQQDREDALADFKNSAIRILVATDVASRGLDILDITYVLNYDFPKDMEEYVHRVGRTGRAGRSGVAISYMTRGDWGKAEELIKILQDAEQEVPPQLEEMAARFAKHQEKMADEKAFCQSFLDGGDGRRGGGGRGGRGRGGYGGRRY